MTKYPCTGSTSGDLSGLYAVLSSLTTDLFSSVEINEAGTELALLDADENVLLRWEMASASGGTGTITAYTAANDTTGISISGNSNCAPTFVVQCAKGIYIARASSNTADGHTSYLVITGTSSGKTAFTFTSENSQSYFYKNVKTVAFGDQVSPANAVTFPAAQVTRNCTCFYPLPTNCPLDGENYTVGFYALAFSQQATTAIGKAYVNGEKCYSNGFFILMDN